jgi:hypothetical protein
VHFFVADTCEGDDGHVKRVQQIPTFDKHISQSADGDDENYEEKRQQEFLPEFFHADQKSRENLENNMLNYNDKLLNLP